MLQNGFKRPYVRYVGHYRGLPASAPSFCYLYPHFEVKQEKSAHVYPSAPCYGMQSVLDACAVSGLVVPCVEAVLEYRGLDIVAFQSCPDFVNASPKLGLVSQDIKKWLDSKLLFRQK